MRRGQCPLFETVHFFRLSPSSDVYPFRHALGVERPVTDLVAEHRATVEAASQETTRSPDPPAKFTVVRRTRSLVLSRRIAVATIVGRELLDPCAKSARMGAVRPMMPWNRGTSGLAIRAQLRRRTGGSTGEHRNPQSHEGAPRRAGLSASAPTIGLRPLCPVLDLWSHSDRRRRRSPSIFERFTSVDASPAAARSASSAAGGCSDTQ